MVCLFIVMFFIFPTSLGSCSCKIYLNIFNATWNLLIFWSFQRDQLCYTLVAKVLSRALAFGHLFEPIVKSVHMYIFDNSSYSSYFPPTFHFSIKYRFQFWNISNKIVRLKSEWYSGLDTRFEFVKNNQMSSSLRLMQP